MNGDKDSVSSNSSSSRRHTDGSVRIFDWGLDPQFENLPPELANCLWCNWKAFWSIKRKGKVEKVPFNNGHTISTTKSDQWIPLQDAQWNYAMGDYNGVGFLMQEENGLVVIDLDGCVKRVPNLEKGCYEYEVDPWAADIVRLLDTYTEVSPSGGGLRLVGRGLIEREFNNHNIHPGGGIEVYDGSSARYLTATGHVWPEKRPVRVIPTEALQWLAFMYQKGSRAAQKAEHVDMPRLLPPEGEGVWAPIWAHLTDAHKWFLKEGLVYGFPTRSELVLSLINRLFQLNQWTDEQILSRLWENAHVQDYCLSHRQDSDERGLKFLWSECLSGRHNRPKDVEEVFRDTRPPPWERTEPEVPKHTQWVEEQMAARRAARGRPVQQASNEMVSFADLSLEQGHDWCIEGLIPERGVGLAIGPPEALKTFLTLDMAACVATGRAFHGHETGDPGLAVVLAGEGEYGVRFRLEAWRRHHGVDREAMRPVTLHGLVDLQDSTTVTDLIDKAAWRAQLLPKVIVVDTFSKFLMGDENSAKDVSAQMRAADALVNHYDCAVLFVHHTGHSSTDRGRGSSALRASVDFEYSIVKDENGVSVMGCEKMKDAERPDPMAFTATTVFLEGVTDRRGRTESSLVLSVKLDYQGPQDEHKDQRQSQLRLLRVLTELTGESLAEWHQGVSITEVRDLLQEQDGENDHIRPAKVKARLRRLTRQVEVFGDRVKLRDFPYRG